MTKANKALRRILDDVDAHALLDGCELDVQGADPILPTNFYVGSIGAAAIAASGLAASALLRLKGTATPMQQGRVCIDVRRGAHAMRSFRYLTLDGEPRDYEWDPYTGFYATADSRQLFFNSSFPPTLERTMACLGLDRPDQIAGAFRTRDGVQLETELIEAGVQAAMVRTAAEWATHPHKLALDALPVMDIVRIGDAPVIPMPTSSRPLGGIRVIDVARAIAGPVAGRTLAEHGARVLRIDRPSNPTDITMDIDSGHGKRSAYLDLATADGIATMDKLVQGADIFSQAFRPGALASRGLSANSLAERRPGIVYVSISAFGHEGPWHWRRGYDSLIQASAGATLEQSLNGVPSLIPAPVLDYAAGYLGAFGAMEALRRRATVGGSWHVRVSLAQVYRWMDDLGRISDQDARQRIDPTRADIQDLLMETDTAFGRLSYMSPVVGMPESPPYWASPVVPIGTHTPTWD